MRNKFTILTGIFILAVFLSACGTAYAQTPQPPASYVPPPTISVNGHGEVQMTPDIAYISIGVHTEGADATETVASNNSQADALIKALVAMGIDAKDIRTTNFSIYPQQERDNDGKLLGTRYIVDNTVYVTLRKIDQVGATLDAAVKAGANNIYGISFDVADKTAVLASAREQAVKDARAQAEGLASAAGVTLGEVQSINASGSNVPGPIYYAKAEMAQDAGSVPIATGQMTISVDVSIVYTIQ